MSKILITGANSFLGRNFMNSSANNDIDEICLIKNKVKEINFSNYSAVLHVAAIVHQTTKIPESEYLKINTELCLSVAKEAKRQGVKQFVFISTVKVFGEFKPERGIWKEDAICEPDDSYGRSKYAAELGLKELIDDNFTVSIIRPPLIYGVGVKANMLSIIKLIDRFPALPLGGIKNKRSFTSIENLVQLIDQVINKNVSGVFLAMDHKPLSTTELSRIIAKHLNKKVWLFSLPGIIISIGKKVMPSIFDRLYGSFEIDNSYTRSTLDYTPKLSTDEGIKKMVEAYLEEKSNS